MNFWSARKLFKAYPEAHYYVCFGKRSNGKTYGSLDYALERHQLTGKQFAYIRRWDMDIKSKQMSHLFDGITKNGLVEKYSNGAWTFIEYKSGQFYRATYLEKENGSREKLVEDVPCGFAFALNNMEHDKSISYPNVDTIIFDEFISRQGYLNDEFVIFQNVVSTIKRQRTDVRILLLGNTVNAYCPYFEEMGLKHIEKMEPGTIDTYNYGEEEKPKVVVEYCSPTSASSKQSDAYFAFDNPKLQMITGGTWEINIYPHLPVKYAPKEVVFTFFINFNHQMLQCEVISSKIGPFIYIHRKTTPIKDEAHDLVYTPEASPRPNVRMCLTKDNSSIGKKIMLFFKNDKVFYQTNEVGEVVRNYIMWSDSHSIKN